MVGRLLSVLDGIVLISYLLGFQYCFAVSFGVYNRIEDRINEIVNLIRLY